MAHPEGPLPAQERIATLDVVRGFALLGILIMNMPGFANSLFVEADGSFVWTGTLDRLAEAARDMLFSGKFNSMFSLLFGIGFTIQFTRMQERTPDRATRLYTRRLLVLLALGLLHGLVFWGGDVLHVYALLGLALLLVLRHASNAVIYVLIALCLLYPAVVGTISLLVTTPDDVARGISEARTFEISNGVAYGTGTFLEAAREHTREFVHYYTNGRAFRSLLQFYVLMATTMLLGLLIGRNNWVRRIPELMPWIRRIQWWALGIGLVCSLAFVLIFELNRDPGPSAVKLLGRLTYGWSRLGLMIFYVLTIVRLVQDPAWMRRFGPIADAGRMPLTNYLLQTLICTTIFYGWGFGLWGQVGPAMQVALAFAIFFFIQAPLSRIWLRRFDYGPLEYVWRVLTYGRSRDTRRRARSEPGPHASSTALPPRQ